jgi:hypothetical protein
MKYKKIIFLIMIPVLVFIFIQGCQDYQEKFEILRNPFIQVKVNNTLYTFTDPKIVSLGQVIESNDLGSSFSIYDRLVIFGIIPGDDFRKIQFSIDIQDIQDQINYYTFSYTDKGGINEIIWKEKNDQDNFESYYSCNEGMENSFFSIIKQNRQEKIISGSFHILLCNINGTDSTITIDGEFRDLKYGETL